MVRGILFAPSEIPLCAHGCAQVRIHSFQRWGEWPIPFLLCRPRLVTDSLSLFPFPEGLHRVGYARITRGGNETLPAVTDTEVSPYPCLDLGVDPIPIITAPISSLPPAPPPPPSPFSGAGFFSVPPLVSTAPDREIRRAFYRSRC
jgi:hypothetical protein